MIVYNWKERSRFVCYKHSIELALQGKEIEGEYVSEDDYYSDYNLVNYDCVVCENANDEFTKGASEEKPQINLKNVELNFLIESLEIVYDLALPNALVEQDTVDNKELLEEYRSQQNALDFVGLLIQDIKALKEEQHNA